MVYNENRLKTEKILNILNIKDRKPISTIENFVSERDNRKGSNLPYLVILKNGLACLFKIRSGSFAEAAAYNASKFLGLKLVPPTVVRKFNNEIASLQFFISDAHQSKKEHRLLLEKISQKDKNDCEIFLYVFGKKHWGKIKNKIVQINNGKLYFALIDNEEFGTIIDTKPINTKIFYQSTLTAFEKLNIESLKDIYKDAYQEGNKSVKQYYDVLFKRILARRDLALAFAKKHTIINE